MKHGIFSVYDSKAAAFIPPFYTPTKGMAVRSFKDAANDPTHAFFRNGEDYTLFQLGWFDDHTGMCEWFETKMPLGTALEFRAADVELPFDAVAAASEPVGEAAAGNGGGEVHPKALTPEQVAELFAKNPPIEGRDFVKTPKPHIKG